jgi:hypothetical protein
MVLLNYIPMKEQIKNKLDCIIMLIIILLAFTQPGCKKLVEVKAPSTSTNSEIVYSSDATATSVLTDLYVQILNSDITRMYLFLGLSSDELTLFNGVTDLGYQAYFSNNLSPSTPGLVDFWAPLYSRIFTTNAAIEGLTASNSLSPNVKQQLLGEAKFLRAFLYFYLINLYGNAPLNVTTDYKANRVRPRTEKALVYEQILTDLKDAKTALGDKYINASFANINERIRPNKFAATAMLARVYLYTRDYKNAEIQSGLVIDNRSVYDTVSLDKVFLKNNKETIWALQTVLSGTNSNTNEGRTFILPVSGPSQNYPVYLSEKLVEKFSPADNRLYKWVKSTTVGSSPYNYSFKYKIGAVNTSSEEYSVVLRLAEQYLIRAEARAQQGNLTAAISDLNLIRKRAGLDPTTATTQMDILNTILKEKELELFTEWGHRWLELKRTDKANEVLGRIKGVNWQSTDQLYPLPQSEIQRNPSTAGQQNSGY